MMLLLMPEPEITANWCSTC